MATSLTRSIIAVLVILVAAASVPTAAAAGGGSLRKRSQVAAASNKANAAAAAAAVATKAQRRRKLEDNGYAGEWSGQYSAGDDDAYAAQADDNVNVDDDIKVWFDDDRYREAEVATVKNFWSMFNHAPRYWTARQWGFFAGVLTLFSIVGLCVLRTICPCFCRCMFRLICPCCFPDEKKPSKKVRSSYDDGMSWSRSWSYRREK
jgi:hypothetical protein